MATKKNGNGSFAVAVRGGSDLVIPVEFAAMLDESDLVGYAPARDVLPYVTIRHTPLVEGKGKSAKVLFPAGGFRMKDKTRPDIPDVAGPLEFTVVFDRKIRTFWRDGSERPVCKSNDDITGFGDPGGACVSCEYNPFNPKYREKGMPEGMPKCKSGFSIACVQFKPDSAEVADLFMLQFGPSGVKGWQDFKDYMKQKTVKIGGKSYPIPLHAITVSLNTEFKEGKKGESDYYIPDPTNLSLISRDQLVAVKELRDTLVDQFQATIEQSTVNGPEHGQPIDVEHSELPEGVTPVDVSPDEEDAVVEERQRREMTDNDGLPF